MRLAPNVPTSHTNAVGRNRRAIYGLITPLQAYAYVVSKCALACRSDRLLKEQTMTGFMLISPDGQSKHLCSSHGRTGMPTRQAAAAGRSRRPGT